MFITGTEVVFLNGVRLTRGVNADYTIVGNVNNTTQILLAVAPTPTAVLSADYQPVS
jgi:hypothetical protein